MNKNEENFSYEKEYVNENLILLNQSHGKIKRDK